MNSVITIQVPEEKLVTIVSKLPEDKRSASAFRWSVKQQVNVDGLREKLMELEANLKQEDCFKVMLSWWVANNEVQQKYMNAPSRYLYSRILEKAESEAPMGTAGSFYFQLAYALWMREGLTESIEYYFKKAEIQAKERCGLLTLLKLTEFYLRIGKPVKAEAAAAYQPLQDIEWCRKHLCEIIAKAAKAKPAKL